MGFKVGKIVTVEDIPEILKDIPLDDLMEVYKVCKQMEILCDINSGIGLSAVQVGIPWKLFLVRSDGKSPFGEEGSYSYFLNCEYKPVDDMEVASMEGCLSLTTKEGYPRQFRMTRWNNVRITGLRLTDNQKLKTEEIDLKLDVFHQGVVFQHEIDHHRGVLISDEGEELLVWG